MTSLHPYPSYRKTDLPWLGQIPAHWDVKRLKWTIEYCQNGAWGNEPNGTDDVACVRVADFDRTRFRVNHPIPTLRALPKVERRDKSLKKGDLLLEKSGGGDLQPVGFVVLYDSDEPAICSNFVARMPVRENYDPNFLCYLHASLYSGKINTQSIKQNTGIQNLDSVAYLNKKVPLPPLPEQQAIAAYLDRQTTKIDALIAKKQRLLDLLAEQRAALISQAVTKGLNPNAKMKDSDVAWLGQVPSYWEVKKIKHVVHRIIDTEHKTAPFYPDGEYFVVRTSNIKGGKLIFDDAKYTDYDGYVEWTQRGIPTPGDILFTREAPAGEACIVPENLRLCVGQRTVLFKINREEIVSEYCLWSLYGGLASEFIELLSQGSTVAHFNMQDIGNIPLLLPPIDEQKAISVYIERETNRLDCLKNKIETAIERLREYRAALISSVVTGKVDVRKGE